MKGSSSKLQLCHWNDKTHSNREEWLYREEVNPLEVQLHQENILLDIPSQQSQCTRSHLLALDRHLHRLPYPLSPSSSCPFSSYSRPFYRLLLHAWFSSPSCSAIALLKTVGAQDLSAIYLSKTSKGRRPRGSIPPART